MVDRRNAAKILVAALVAAVAAQGPLLAQEAASPLRITRPVHATAADVDPGRLYSNPALAVHPDDPLVVVGGFADYRTRKCGLIRSADGGATWARVDSSPNPAEYPYCAQSQGGVIQAPVAFSDRGTLYMALGGWDEQDGGARLGGAVLLARSDDLGDTWETSVAYTARGKTGVESENVRPVQGLAVDSRGGEDTVYLTFNLSYPETDFPNAKPATAAVAISRDGGRSFEPPVKLAETAFSAEIRAAAFAATRGSPDPDAEVPPPGSLAAQPDQPANFGSPGRSRNGIMPAVDGAGNVYVLWPTDTANLDPSPPRAVMLSKSTDAGATWTHTLAIPYGENETRGGPANSYAKFAASADGTLHMVYGINPTDVEGYGETFYQQSTDGGATWSERRSLTDSSLEDYGAQYFPNLKIAPNGRIDVAWWDVRDDPGVGANDVYYAYSEDNGATWSGNLRITDRSVDRRYGVWGRNYDITSPPGVASADEYALFGWDDTRGNLDLTGTAQDGLGAGVQDIFTAALQFEAVGGGTSATAKAVLAGVIGLIAVGLVLLAVGLAGGRRPGRPVPSPKAAQATASKVG